jgi:hypothetical protein
VPRTRGVSKEEQHCYRGKTIDQPKQTDGANMSEAKNTPGKDKQTKVNSNPQAKPRIISDPRDVAQLVMMRIDQVNSKKDELTIAVKALADTAKQLVSVYAKQQAQIEKLAKKVADLEKAGGKQNA